MRICVYLGSSPGRNPLYREAAEQFGTLLARRGIGLVYGGITELHVVKTMHERKAMMAKLADGFVTLPGGIGTFEEMFEAWCWAQLGYHQKPVGLLNVGDFYDGLTQFIDKIVEEGFLQERHRAMLMIEREPEAPLDRMTHYMAPETEHWLGETDL